MHMDGVLILIKVYRMAMGYEICTYGDSYIVCIIT